MYYEIDGSNFSNLEEFWEEAENVFADFITEVGAFGENFAAFRDILCVAPENTVVIWKHSKLSLQNLGYVETKKQLELALLKCHHSWTDIIKKKIEIAQFNRGETIFDDLAKIFVEEENIQLRLE